MTRRIILFVALALVLFLINYFGLSFGLEGNQEAPRFSILSVCLFHLIASVLVYVIEELAIETVPSQAGVAYLALVFIKMGIFIMVFSSSILSTEGMYMSEKLVLIIPFLLNLFLEGFFVAKSLKIMDGILSGKEIENSKG